VELAEKRRASSIHHDKHRVPGKAKMGSHENQRKLGKLGELMIDEKEEKVGVDMLEDIFLVPRRALVSDLIAPYLSIYFGRSGRSTEL